MEIQKQIFILILLISVLSTYAQDVYNMGDEINIPTKSSDLSKMSFGMKISPAISWIDVVNTDMQADGATMKFGVGGVFNYQILNNLSLVSGVNYNAFGGYVFDNKSLNNTVFKSNYTANYTEIEVPLAVRLCTTPQDKMSFFLQGGFSAGFIINANEKRIPLDKDKKTDYVDITLLTNPSRLNCIIGGGLNYLVGNKTYIFGLISYKKSLNNIANTSAYVSSRYVDLIQMYPGSMEFSVGIMF